MTDLRTQVYLDTIASLRTQLQEAQQRSEALQQENERLRKPWCESHEIGTECPACIAVGQLIRAEAAEGEITRLRSAIAQHGPQIASEVDGDLSCFWCGQWEMEPHAPECEWAKACAALADKS